MGYPLDVAAQNAALDALLSRDVSAIPTEFEVALYDGHPSLGGVELDPTGGYVRPAISLDLTDFPAAVGGQKVSVSVEFDDATDEFSDTAPYAVLISAADSTTRWWVVLLTEEVDVTEAGPVPSVVLSIQFNTEE